MAGDDVVHVQALEPVQALEQGVEIDAVEPDLALVEDVVTDEHYPLLGAVDAGLLGEVTGSVVALKGVAAHFQGQLVAERDIGPADFFLALVDAAVELDKGEKAIIETNNK